MTACICFDSFKDDLMETQALSLPPSPGEGPASRRGWALAHLRRFAMACGLWATAIGLASAQPVTGSATLNFSPAISGLKVMGTSNQQVVYRGALVYTESGFPAEASANPGNPTYWLRFGFGFSNTSIAGQGASNQNVFIRATAAPSLSGCPGITNNSYSSNLMIITWLPNTPLGSGNCAVTVSVPVEISVGAGTPPGSFLGSDFNAPFVSPYTMNCYAVPMSGYTWAMRVSINACNTSSFYAPTLTGVSSNTITNIGCTLTATNTNVVLPTVSTSSLQVSGDVAGYTPFTIQLQGCNNATPATVNATATWLFDTGYIDNSVMYGGVDYLGVQMACAPSGAALSFASNSPSLIRNGAHITMFSIPSGAINAVASANCAARYIADGDAATAGDFYGIAQFMLIFN